MESEQPMLLMLSLDRYVMRACARLGVGLVAVCSHSVWDRGSVDVPAGVTVLRVDDQTEPESVLAGLHRAGLAGTRFDAVLTSNERSLVPAELLGAVLGCPRADPMTAVLLRDKGLQKDRIRAAGIPTARAAVVVDLHQTDGREAAEFELAVLKPIAGSGTRDTRTIIGADGLRRHARRARATGGAERTYLVEEAVAGDEWVVDGVVHEGEVVFYGLGRYAQPCLTLMESQAPLTMRRFDPDTESAAYELADPVVRGAISALGLSSGVFHMELFHDTDRGRLIFSECAGRRGGGLIHEEVQCKFGVDLGEAAVRCALGRDPGLKPVVNPATVGCAYLLGRPGTLIRCPEPADLAELPGVEFARLHLPWGSRLGGGPTSTSQRLGEVLLAADSPSGLDRLADGVRDFFDQRLVVAPAGATQRELRRFQAAHWPSASSYPELFEQDV